MEIIKVILTSLLSAAVLFLLAKIMGHKQISQLDFFDYITGITIGSIAAELATELEDPLKPLIAMVVYGVIAVLLSILTNKFPRTRKYINGTPTILMHNGKFYRKNMKKAKLDLSEFMVMCRQQGYFDLNDIQMAIFEFNGKLSILPVSGKRPVNPDDLNLSPQPASIRTEVIMDGRILGENKYIISSLVFPQKKRPASAERLSHSLLSNHPEHFLGYRFLACCLVQFCSRSIQFFHTNHLVLGATRFLHSFPL